MNLPRGLVNLLVDHRKRQNEEAGSDGRDLWTDTGFIFWKRRKRAKRNCLRC